MPIRFWNKIGYGWGSRTLHPPHHIFNHHLTKNSFNSLDEGMKMTYLCLYTSCLLLPPPEIWNDVITQKKCWVSFISKLLSTGNCSIKLLWKKLKKVFFSWGSRLAKFFKDKSCTSVLLGDKIYYWSNYQDTLT